MAAILLQNESKIIFLKHLNHAKFLIIGISIKNGPFLQSISNCVIVKLNFAQKCIYIDFFLIKNDIYHAKN